MKNKLVVLYMKYPIYFCAALTIFISSCKKDSTAKDIVVPPEVIKSDLSIQFDNRIGDNELHLNLESYTSVIYSETYTVTALRYYISNISVTNTGDTVYTVPQDSSYFQVDQSDFNTWFANVKVPVGDYKTLTFVVGIDSLRNTMDISKRKGVLDPTTGANGMYWGSDSGYIFLKFEGTSPASTEAGNVFMYHIGGYGGNTTPIINNLKTITLDLSVHGIAQVRTGTKSNIHLFVDVSKIFDNHGLPISIAQYPVVMFSDFSKNVAYNYATMFSHNHTEN
jgi:hypothetical protein